MPKIKVLFFARARELVGAAEQTLELPADADSRLLLEHLYDAHPPLRDLAQSVVLAVNHEYVSPSDPPTVLKDGDEVALIPPISALMSPCTSAPASSAAPPTAEAEAEAGAAGEEGRVWESVGADVLLAVLQRLTAREWAACCCVCSHWRRTAMDASLWQEACHREFAIHHPSLSPLSHLLLDSLPPSHSSVTPSPTSYPPSSCSSFSSSCSCSSASSSSASPLLPPLPSPFFRIFPRAYLSPHRPYLCLAARLAHVLRGVARWRALIRYRRSSRPSRISNREGRSTWSWRAVPARVVMQGGVTIWVAFDLARGQRGASSPGGTNGSIGRREAAGGGVEDGGEGHGRGDGGMVRGRAGDMGGMHEEEAMMVEVQGLWRGGGVGTGAMWVTLFRTHTDASCHSTHGAHAHATPAASAAVAAAAGVAAGDGGREWVEDEARDGEEWEDEAGVGGEGGVGAEGGAAGQWERVQQSHMTGLCLYSGSEWTLLASFFHPPATPPTTTIAAASSPSAASLCARERAEGQRGGGEGPHGVVFLHAMHLLHCFPLPLPHSTPLCCPTPTSAASAASSSCASSPPATPPCTSLSVLIDWCLPRALHCSLLPSQALSMRTRLL
ncbi:unnamed protein product [Closterium sp. Naga37s-1]|nr:unnamed protein product [Closterium sp. Naga37s-1]